MNRRLCDGSRRICPPRLKQRLQKDRNPRQPECWGLFRFVGTAPLHGASARRTSDTAASMSRMNSAASSRSTHAVPGASQRRVTGVHPPEPPRCDTGIDLEHEPRSSLLSRSIRLNPTRQPLAAAREEEARFVAGAARNVVLHA